MPSFESGFNPSATKFAGRSKDAVENLGSLYKRGLGTDADAFRLVAVIEIERHVKGTIGDLPLHPKVSNNDAREVTTEGSLDRGQRKWNNTWKIAVLGKLYKKAVGCERDWLFVTPEIKFVVHKRTRRDAQR